MRNILNNKSPSRNLRGSDDADGLDALINSYLVEGANFERRLFAALGILRIVNREAFHASRRKRRTRTELLEHSRAVRSALERIKKIVAEVKS